MIIVFFRHGIAVNHEDFKGDDAERPLTDEGIRKVQAAGRGLARMKLPFDRLLTSPWLRASRTADVLCEALGGKPPVQVLPQLAGDCPAETLLEAVAEQRSKCALLVGHQPQLGDAVARIIGAKGITFDLKKGGAAAVSVEKLPSSSPATLLWLMTSRQLKWVGK